MTEISGDVLGGGGGGARQGGGVSELVGSSSGLLLATGSSAFLASLLVNMAVRNMRTGQQLTTTTSTTSTRPPSTQSSTTASSIPTKGCPDGWVDGRSVDLGCVWAEIREDPLLLGEDYNGNIMDYSLGGGEGVNQVRIIGSIIIMGGKI